jgi:cyanophycinase-like exopeptidase
MESEFRPGPLLFYSTSPMPAPALAVDLALGGHAHRPERLRMVVLQTALDQPADSQVETLREQFSGHGIELDACDPGLQTRDDAYRDDVVAIIRSADIVQVTGGEPGRMMRIVEGTPALEALREASAQGAVVGGGSAGAMM